MTRLVIGLVAAAVALGAGEAGARQEKGLFVVVLNAGDYANAVNCAPIDVTITATMNFTAC